MVTRTQVECDFIYSVLPKLRLTHGENLEAFKEEWVNYLNELIQDRKIPKRCDVEWELPKLN